MSEISFPPQLHAELSQQTLNISDRSCLGSIPLAAGHIVTGFTAFEHFNAVEEQICNQLSPVERDQDTPSISVEPTIAQERIAAILRPSGFNGRMHSGFVVVLPFSAAQAVRCDQRVSGDVASAKLTDERPGLRVVYCSDLVMARGDSFKLVRDSAYYHRYAEAKPSAAHKAMAQGGLRRLVASDAELQRHINLAIGSSTARSTRLMGHGIRHPARG